MLSGALYAALALTACAAGKRAAPAADDPCLVVRADRGAPDTITFALTEPVNWDRAPSAGNRTERLVFGLLYDPLVRIDCRGRVIPGLANVPASTGSAAGTAVLTLRNDIRFWNDATVDARQIAERLRDAPAAARPRLDLLDAQRLLFTPTREVPDVRALSAPARAIRGEGSWGRWPLGTGSYRPLRRDLVASPRFIPDDPAAPVIWLMEALGRDPRDLLDSGVDVLLLGDAEGVAYARSHPGYEVLPLPWDRTYVYVSASSRSDVMPPLAVAEALARDVVPASSRVAEGSHWWSADASCIGEPGAMAAIAAPRTSRVAFDGRDPVARAIAQRLVALAQQAEKGESLAAFGELRSAGARASSAAMSAEQLTGSLANGEELGYVIALERHAHDGCPAAPTGLAGIPWLRQNMIVQLVETRAHLVVRRGVANTAIDGNGLVRILPRGQSAEVR